MFVRGSFTLFKVHRERMFMHVCVCVCAPAIKKWSRTESRNIFDIVGTRMGHALFFSL